MTEYGINLTVVVYYLTQCLYIFSIGIYQLSDTARIIHGLMLQGRKTIIKNGIADVQDIILILGTTTLIFSEFNVGYLLLTGVNMHLQSLEYLIHHMLQFIGILLMCKRLYTAQFIIRG